MDELIDGVLALDQGPIARDLVPPNLPDVVAQDRAQDGQVLDALVAKVGKSEFADAQLVADLGLDGWRHCIVVR